MARKYLISFSLINSLAVASLAQCSLPTDDGDGVINRNDLDDDNDGISDLNEQTLGSHRYLPANNPLINTLIFSEEIQP